MLATFIFNDKLKHRDNKYTYLVTKLGYPFFSRILHQLKAELPVAPNIAEYLAISAYRTISSTPPTSPERHKYYPSERYYRGD